MGVYVYVFFVLLVCFFLRDLQGVMSARLLRCVCVRESECVYICVYTDLFVCIHYI